MGDSTDTSGSGESLNTLTRGIFISTLTTPWGCAGFDLCMRSLGSVDSKSGGFALIAQCMDGTWWSYCNDPYPRARLWLLRRYLDQTIVGRALTLCGV